MKPDADSEVVGRDVEVIAAGLIVVVTEDSALLLVDIRSSYLGITSNNNNIIYLPSSKAQYTGLI